MTDRDFDEYIASLYREMELDLIDSMIRNLGLHKAEEELVGFNYPQWQAIKLKELRRYQRENKKIINSITNKIPKKIAEHIKEELTQGSLDEMKKYRQAMAKGYKSSVVMKDGFFKVNDKKVSALIKALTNDIETANHAALRMINDTYRTVIFRTGFFLSHGAVTEKQAYDMAVKDFLSRGINCIQYKDGRRVNIADYTSMAVRTANQRAYMMGEGEFRKEIGETLITITRHSTSCSLCKPFENKVLIDDVYSAGSEKDGNYPLLSSAMAKGLFHPRCRHGLGTYYPELDDEIKNQSNTNNHLQEYSKEADSKAHTDNMVQKYTRLQRGCVTDENKQKYGKQLREWEKRQKFYAANSPDMNTGKRVYYNERYSYDIKLKDFSNEVNNSISKAAKSVAQRGTEQGIEVLNLVNLDNGAFAYYEYGDEFSVGNENFWSFLQENKKKRFAFIHNHNTDGYLSETDMRTLLTNEQISVMIAVRNDSVIYAVRKAKSTPKNKVYFDYLYPEEIEEINSKCRSGEITSGERTYLREKLIVDNLIRDFTYGLEEFDGRK